jgi:hypothetical protein
LIYLAQALCWILAIPVAGLLWRTFGARLVTILGLILIGIPTIGLSRLNIDTGRVHITLLLGVQGIGLGLVLIPMMGGAVTVLPPHLVADGVVFRTMVQRIGAALGLAPLSALATAQRAQHFADRSSFVDVSALRHNPDLAQMHQHGPGGLLPAWVNVQARALTDAYGDVYLVVGAITLLTIPVVLVGRWARPGPARQASRDLVEVGT